MNALSISRLFQLMKIDFVVNQKNIAVTAATLIVFLALLPMHFSASFTVYFLLLYTIGFIITGNAFAEIHDSKKAAQYLMLPCSNVERFLSKLLLTAIVFPVLLVFIFYALSCLSVFMNAFFYHREVTLFDLRESVLWIGIGKYIIFQSIFLLGAIYFNKNAIIKTTLMIGCMLIALTSLLFIFSWMICPGCEQVNAFDLVAESAKGLYFIFWIVVAPFCWLGTYLLISDSEIK